MKISFMKTFLVAAKTLNISKTAVARGVSQPAISKQIKELEKTVGCLLFDRISNRIHLTEQGKYFIRKAERIVEIYEQAVNELRDTNLIGNNVRLGTSSTLGMIALPDIIKKITQKNPDINASAEVKSVNNLLDALRRNDLDLCLVEGDTHAYSGEFILQPLCQTKLVFISQKGLFPADKGEFGVGDLSDQTILFREEGESYDQVFCTYAADNSIHFDKKNNFADLTVLKKFVELGLGIGCIPECLICDEDKKKFEIRTIKGHNIKYDFNICVAHEHKLEGNHGKMIDVSKAIIKNISKKLNLTICD